MPWAHPSLSRLLIWFVREKSVFLAKHPDGFIEPNPFSSKNANTKPSRESFGSCFPVFYRALFV